jgi:hypothetical protein
MTINIDEILKAYEKKYGKLEVDGYYGEQCTLEQAGEILYQGIGQWKTYRKVWECSKRILDVEEKKDGK